MNASRKVLRLTVALVALAIVGEAKAEVGNVRVSRRSGKDLS